MLYHKKRGRRALLGSLSLVAVLGSQPAAAQDVQDKAAEPAAQAPGDAPSAEPAEDDLHDRRRDTQGIIVVSAQGLKQFDLLAGTTVVEAGELQMNMAGQIGDVLAKVPGVSASGFAPGVSRPILRGFGGERVKVLIDGIGSIDASNTSADHAVSIDPLTAESIEVLRGPAVLLYGSQAIGGAVNVIDKRIPRRLPADGHAHVDAMLRGDTASNLRETGASVDVPLGNGFVAHADGSWRKSGDLAIAGYAVAPGLRSDLLANAKEEADEGHADEAALLREQADQRGHVPNTGTRTYSANGGIAFFRGDSNLGVSIGLYDTRYGIPTRPGAGHVPVGGDSGPETREGEDNVSIALRQWRADLRADVDMGEGFFDRLRVRAGYSDYTHTEFEGAQPGTVFDVKGMEARAELVQNPHGDWRGSIGTQYTFRTLSAEGAEAYLPPNRTEQIAAFALQEYGGGPFQIEGSGRFETTRVDSVPLGLSRQFNALSGALGLSYEPNKTFRTGINLSRVARAPSAEEMFAHGGHVATQAFEIGNPDLRVERAWGAELYARGRVGAVEFNLAAYKNWFNSYIYLAETGAVEDGLPVFAYLQSDATYAGFEGEVRLPLLDTVGWKFGGDLRGEYVKARLDDGTPVPRIPPLRLLSGIDAKSDRLDGRFEVEWTDHQHRLAPYETVTKGFTMVNAAITWRPFPANKAINLIVKADNIFDVTGRRHASFTKDFLPLAGRNFTASLNVSL